MTRRMPDPAEIHIDVVTSVLAALLGLGLLFGPWIVRRWKGRR